MVARKRCRSVYAVAIPLVVLAALATRGFPEHLPRLVSQHGGDTLWALTAFLVFGLAWPSWSTARAATAALALSCIVEVSQLYHAPWIDWLRGTVTGGYLLGYEFIWTDLLCYLVGVWMGVFLEALLLRKVAFAATG